MKVAIIYAYYETHKSIGNLNYFLKNGGYIDSPKIDYYLVINGKKCSVDVPQNKSNLKLLFKPNKGHGWGGWQAVIKETDMTPYTHFIFMKDYMIGPFIYSWMQDKINWIQIFTQMITKKVKLAGPAINIKVKRKFNVWHFSPHVLSAMFVTDKIGLSVVKEILNTKYHPDDIKREIVLSQKILNQGYQIKSLQQAFQNLDFQIIKNYKLKDNKKGKLLKNDKITKILPNIDNRGDVYNKNGYYGTQVNPYEVIFYKRKNDTPELDLAIRSNTDKIKF